MSGLANQLPSSNKWSIVVLFSFWKQKRNKLAAPLSCSLRWRIFLLCPAQIQHGSNKIFSFVANVTWRASNREPIPREAFLYLILEFVFIWVQCSKNHCFVVACFSHAVNFDVIHFRSFTKMNCMSRARRRAHRGRLTFETSFWRIRTKIGKIFHKHNPCWREDILPVGNR